MNMLRWIGGLTFCLVVGIPSRAQTTLSPVQDVRAAVQAAAPGDTIILNNGTYNVPGQIEIRKALTIRAADGASPVLQFPASEIVPIDVKASNVTLQGFRVTNGQWGIYAGDSPTAYSNIVIRGVTVTSASTTHGIYVFNVTNALVENSRVEFAGLNAILVQGGSGAVVRGNTVVNTGGPDAAIKILGSASAYVYGNTVQNSGPGSHGILVSGSADAVVDSNSIAKAHSNGINIHASSHRAAVINNTVTTTTALHGIAVENSNDVVVAGNTVGANQFGIILRGAVNGRVERNIVNGALQDGIVVTDAEGTRSQHVYVGRNTVVSQGLASNNGAGTGIWLNNETTGTLVYANTASGVPENGLTIFNSSNNHFWGNVTTDNGHGGIFIYGPAPGELSYSSGNNPVNTYIQGNYAYALPANAGVMLHRSTQNTVFNNYVRNSPAGVILQSGTGNNRLFLNTLRDNTQGMKAFAGASGLSTYFLNRHLTVTQNDAEPGSSVQPHGGATFGGNFQQGGKVLSDPYPYASETLNRTASVSVIAPTTGAVVAQGTRKTIEWRSSGCTLVDLHYKSPGTGVQPIAAGYPDVGVYQWAVPAALAPGSGYTVVITCKLSTGSGIAEGVSGTFTVAGGGLELLSPQTNHPVTGGATTLVSWKRSGNAATGGVNILFRSSPTASPVTLATGVTDNEHVVTVPTGASSQSSFIIEHASSSDSTDGFVSMRGTAAATSPSGTLAIGTLQVLQWVSPAGSNYVDIEYRDTTTNTYKSLASNLPDFGRFYFLVPDQTLTASHIRVTFKSTTSTPISSIQTGNFNTAATGFGGGDGGNDGGGNPGGGDGGGNTNSPDLVSLTPLSGSGTTVTATAVFRHPGGQSSHYLGYILFLPLPNVVSFDAQGTCEIEFNRMGGRGDGRGGVRLINNAGTGWLGPIEGVPAAPGTAPLTNNACTVNAAGVTVSFSGTDMTVRVPVTFHTPANLSATMGAFIQSNSTTDQWTDFRQFGNWTVPGAPVRPGPRIVSGTPTTGSGSTATFTITAGHSSGWNQLGEVHIRFASSIVGSPACHIIYSPAANLMTMINDAGTALLAHVPLGQPLTTNRCSVRAGATRRVIGTNVMFTLPVNFNATAFGTGSKNVYVNGFDINGAVTHWVQTGTWTVQ